MEFGWMLAPAVACLLMALVLVWFGLHVLQRGVVFIDLALAQVAALGTTYGVFLGHEPDEPIAYVIGLTFTVIGAIAFALVRHFDDRVPQEALIGVAYVVCAAAGAVLLDFAADPHGAEKLQHLLVGNLVWVTWAEIGTIGAVVLVVGAVHWAIRKPLLAVSFDPQQARFDGMKVALWDLAFYLTFGLVITALVHVAGVLLIFSYLIIPAVVARLFVDGLGPRLLLAWAVAVPVSLVGVGVSYEYSAGPIIVCLLGAVLLVALVVVALRRADAPGKMGVGMALSFVAIGVLLWALSEWQPEHAHEVVHDHVRDEVLHDDLPIDADPSLREAWYRGHAHDAALLRDALHREEDLSLRLLLGAALARQGDRAGLVVLAKLTQSDIPFLRMEADDRLRAVAGDSAPSFDPLLGADDARVWSTWVDQAPKEWSQREEKVELP